MINYKAAGGGGSGFEGVAHINDGNIFQCEIINPDKNYTSSPSILIDTQFRDIQEEVEA